MRGMLLHERARTVTAQRLLISGSGVRNPDGALSVNNRNATRQSAGVAPPEISCEARRSAGALHTVRGAELPPGGGRPTLHDPGHVSCGFQRIRPFSIFRRRARAATAEVLLPGLCRGHRSRRHHCTNHDSARAGVNPANGTAEPQDALPRQQPRSSLLTSTTNTDFRLPGFVDCATTHITELTPRS